MTESSDRVEGLRGVSAQTPGPKGTGKEEGRTYSQADMLSGPLLETLRRIDALVPHITSEASQEVLSRHSPEIGKHVNDLSAKMQKSNLEGMPSSERKELLRAMRTTSMGLKTVQIVHDPLLEAIATIEKFEASTPEFPQAASSSTQTPPPVESARAELRQKVLSNLQRAFDERIERLRKKKESQGLSDKEATKYQNLMDNKGLTIKYLEAHFGQMIERATKSPFGGITESKSVTGLPYSLRCFHNKETGKDSFEISFGKFSSGKEARIKDLVDLETGQRRVKRDLRNKSDEAKESELSVAKILMELEGVPGVAHVMVQKYEGKDGKEKTKLVLERYEGGDLFEFLRSISEGDSEENRRKKHKIATGLVRSICEIHKRGVVFLDLREENVLLDSDGNTYLTDFGFAARTNEEITPRGTNGYIPPDLYLELLSGRSTRWMVNPKQDLWALGLTLLSILSAGVDSPISPFLKDIDDTQRDGRDITHIVDELIKLLNSETCPIEQPFGRIIAKLLAPNAEARMSDEELAGAWPGYAVPQSPEGGSRPQTPVSPGVQIRDLSPGPSPAVTGRAPQVQTSATAPQQPDFRATVLQNLSKAFDERIVFLKKKMGETWKQTRDVDYIALEAEYKKFENNKQKTINYLRDHFDEMIGKATKSSVGGITESKSVTGLPFSLRCFHDRKTGADTFEISFGVLVKGGEAKLKDLVDLGTGGQSVKRDLLEKTEDAQSKELRVTEILHVLEGVPGIAHVRMQEYEGKGGVRKTKLLLERYPHGDLIDYVNAYHGADVKANLLKNTKVATGLVRAVCAMHQRGVLHLDLKLDNVLLDKGDVPFLTDFSFAVRIAKGGRTEVNRRGSAGSVDPSMYRRPSPWVVTPQQDLWSLGLMLVSLMCTDVTTEYNEYIEEISKGQKKGEDVTAIVADLIKRLRRLTCRFGQPYGKIIASLLDPNPDTRMTDDQLAAAWPEIASKTTGGDKAPSATV